MIIIETEYQLTSFKNDFNSHPSIVFPVWVDHQHHPIRCDLSFLFIRCNSINYILSLEHIDCVNQNYNVVKGILEGSKQQKIVFNLTLDYVIIISKISKCKYKVFYFFFYFIYICCLKLNCF